MYILGSENIFGSTRYLVTTFLFSISKLLALDNPFFPSVNFCLDCPTHLRNRDTCCIRLAVLKEWIEILNPRIVSIHDPCILTLAESRSNSRIAFSSTLNGYRVFRQTYFHCGAHPLSILFRS